MTSQRRPSNTGQYESQDASFWDTSLQIPCVHFVNYNTVDGFANLADRGVNLGDRGSNPDPNLTQWIEMNIEETMAVLTRCSFDESHRQPIFNLGGIPALAELIQVRKKKNTKESLVSCLKENVRKNAVW